MRFRDVALAVANVLALPLFWLWDLPNALRWSRLDARAYRDRGIVFDWANTRAVRRWTRDFSTMASGLETYELVELELADGRRIVRSDESGRIRGELAARGISKIMCTHLGGDVSVLALFTWITCVALPIAIVVILVISWRACRS